MSPTTAKNSSRSLSYMNSNLDNKASRYKLTNITLSFGTWSGDSIPYTYTLSIPGVSNNNDINVILNSTDKDIANAWMDLSVVSGIQATDSLTLYAYGRKPSVDIPISVLVGDEVSI